MPQRAPRSVLPIKKVCAPKFVMPMLPEFPRLLTVSQIIILMTPRCLETASNMKFIFSNSLKDRRNTWTSRFAKM